MLCYEGDPYLAFELTAFAYLLSYSANAFSVQIHTRLAFCCIQSWEQKNKILEPPKVYILGRGANSKFFKGMLHDVTAYSSVKMDFLSLPPLSNKFCNYDYRLLN